LSGTEFDQAYKALTLERHEEMARLLERAVARAADPGLRIFAERALPTVRKHLDEANGIGL
jgi:predicted outer membrane protein